MLEQLINLSDNDDYFQKNERALRKFFESTDFEVSIGKYYQIKAVSINLYAGKLGKTHARK